MASRWRARWDCSSRPRRTGYWKADQVVQGDRGPVVRKNSIRHHAASFSNLNDLDDGY